MKKIVFIMAICCLCGCSSSETKEGTGTYTNTKQETASARVKMKDETIVEVELDETTNGTTKKTLGADYHMKQASAIGKEWNEQVMFLETYIEQNGIDNIQVNDEGKAENEDIKTGCTIVIDGFLKAIEDAKANIAKS